MKRRFTEINANRSNLHAMILRFVLLPLIIPPQDRSGGGPSHYRHFTT
jgi:hypothetical protein